jgi:hypothetical protein
MVVEIRPSQSYGPYSSASIDVKTGAPNPADFASTRPLIYWRVLAIRAMFGRPLANRPVTAAICQRSPQPLRELPQSVKEKLSHGKSRRIWTTGFYIDGCGTLQTVALRWTIFKPKKGSVTISLGLNYCSLDLSQPLFRDTVPVNVVCSFIL